MTYDVKEVYVNFVGSLTVQDVKLLEVVDFCQEMLRTFKSYRAIFNLLVKGSRGVPNTCLWHRQDVLLYTRMLSAPPKSGVVVIPKHSRLVIRVQVAKALRVPSRPFNLRLLSLSKIDSFFFFLHRKL